MRESTILVPVHYPLKEQSVRTLKRAIELADDQGDAELFILHINVIHQDENVTTDDLIRAVECKFGRLANATYDTSNSFLVEEAILYEAVQQEVDFVVIGKDRRARWRRILSQVLGKGVDIQAFLEEHLDANLVVV